MPEVDATPLPAEWKAKYDEQEVYRRDAVSLCGQLIKELEQAWSEIDQCEFRIEALQNKVTKDTKRIYELESELHQEP